MRLRMQYADDASWQNIQPGQAFQDPLCFPPSLGEGGEETVLLLRSSYFGEVCYSSHVSQNIWWETLYYFLYFGILIL